MVSQTPNYQLNIPAPTDSMADPVPQIDKTWDEVNGAANPPIISVTHPWSPPGTGYKLSERIYIEDPGVNAINSSFICIVDSPTWGNWWIPVQSPMASWRAIPAAAFAASGIFENVPSDPVTIAVTSQSRVHFKGQFRRITGQFTNDVDELLFTLPVGLRPPANSNFIASLDPTNFNASGGTYDQLRTGTVTMNIDGTVFFRAHGATASPLTNRAYMNQVRFPIGRNDFTA